LAKAKLEAVIPSSAARKTPYPLDRKAYRRRNVIERLFCPLKNRRRIATLYDRLAADYPSAVALVVALIAWI
jgi:transposase